MNCEEARVHLAEPPAEWGVETRRHVESCVACREAARAHGEAWRLLLAASGARPSEGFLRGVRAKIHAPANRVFRFLAPLAAAAAAVIVVVVSLASPPVASDPVAEVTREVQRLPAEEQALFKDLTDAEVWDLAENFEIARSIDVVGAERLGQDRLHLLGERK
jgi:hypothetical protein